MSNNPKKDIEIARLLELEARRQKETINLIAAENYASRAVLEAQGSMLTNKYAEGYPQRRYYAGCPNIDAIENLAIERAKKLFNAEHANVQPHSGSQANMAVYFAFLEPGDTVMGMSLSHGGHLTHGAPVNFSGKWYHFISYGLDPETERLDYDNIEKLAVKHKPRLIIAGASAYPRIIDFSRFRHIADAAGAQLMVDMAHLAGLVATNLHPSPIPHAPIITSSTHKTLRGPRSGFILCKAELTSKIDAAVFPMMQGGPLMHAIAAKAIAFFEAMQPDFITYQKAVLENAQVLAAELKQQGLRLISGGTDNHLILVDLTQTGITGIVAQEALEAAGILVNRNAIPSDPRPPQITSGIRLGTPAIATRGFGPKETKQIAAFIMKVLSNPEDKKIQKEVTEQVVAMCRRFPTPGIN
ncbi:MAG: serine hydroxymethyltransferase [Chloroflexi bacterium RBG_13_50_10]|nr:MAG: serine hydroxymethyltransferase [Chloroflexi bacterium RBG_13_50_10]